MGTMHSGRVSGARLLVGLLCLLGTGHAAGQGPATVDLSGTIRDFRRSHSDFDVVPVGGPGHYAGNVALDLPASFRPLYTGTGYKVAAQWTDTSGRPIAPHMFGRDGTDPEPATAEDCGALDVLLVVGNAAVLSSQDAAKKAMLESWGHVVNVIDDQATQAEIDSAAAMHGVVYISEEVDHGNVGNKYYMVPIGVVNEDKDLSDHELGFSTSKKTWTGPTITITDNTHPITEGLPLGDLVITDDDWNMTRADGTIAPGGRKLAEKPNQVGPPALMVIERGDLTKDNVPAPARRVRLPWANHSLDFNTINAIGQTIMRRAVCWAGSNNPPPCGDVNDASGTASTASDGAITSAATFDQWYSDLLGVNLAKEHAITLIRDGSGVYEHLDGDFHPIDGQLYGNEGDAHNLYFTYAIEAAFTYEACAGQFIEFAGADDCWIFINGAMGIDLGGVVPGTTQIIELDRLGLAGGQSYVMHLFFAHRGSSASEFNLRTNLVLSNDQAMVTANLPCD